MELSDFIRLGFAEPALPFLIIGGYAVAAHGHTRATFDVDFLVRRDDREAWIARLAKAGVKMFAQSGSFAQFSQAERGDSLDLMFVSQETFEPMWQASEERAFDGQRARVPNLDHLLALKLHALKQALPHRTSKDAEDVETLILRNRIDLATPRYEQLFLKSGNGNSTTPSSASCVTADRATLPNLDFDLPEITEVHPRSLPPLCSIEQMIQRSRELRRWFPAGLPTEEERWLAKSNVEFCL